jgi:hypothetical protein
MPRFDCSCPSVVTYAYVIRNKCPLLTAQLRFQDSCAKILDILEGKPDLIIGNYTDGNLVASLMSSKLGVTQVHD